MYAIQYRITTITVRVSRVSTVTVLMLLVHPYMRPRDPLQCVMKDLYAPRTLRDEMTS